MKPVWELPSLLKRKLWIVTGKGGVGKTTMAAALGLLASQHGLKVLLVETHRLTHLGEVFEVGVVGYQPQKIRPNLSLVQLNPEDAFEEYVLQQIKFKFVYNTVFNNRYVRSFIDAAPGLTELLTIGKIWALVEEKSWRGKRGNFDLVIIDAPSTGHGLALFTISQTVVDAVRVGPLHTKAKQILDLLRDPQKTLTWLVSLPEEMPVSEVAEMADKLENQVKMELGPVLMNQVWPEILSEDSQADLQQAKVRTELFKVYLKRLEQSRHYEGKLQERLFHKQQLELPLVYQSKTPLHIAQKLAEAIRSQLTTKAKDAVNL